MMMNYQYFGEKPLKANKFNLKILPWKRQKHHKASIQTTIFLGFQPSVSFPTSNDQSLIYNTTNSNKQQQKPETTTTNHN